MNQVFAMHRKLFYYSVVLWAMTLGAGPQVRADSAPPPGILVAEFANLPRLTSTRHHKTADPINVGLVGSKDEIITAMQQAGWFVPVPITLKSSAGIVGSVALRRAYFTAPVSTLYYQGRSQDLAFEKEVGRSALRRHHVRFWKLRDDGPGGRALWIGAATFDKGVGFSHRSGAVTHHIDANVDQERGFLMDELRQTSQVTATYTVPAQGPTKGRNGGGDVWTSDGDMLVGVIAPAR